MVLKVRKTISDHRKRLLPGLVALSLLAGVVVSIVATPNAQADYNTGCGYGYSSTGTGFGYGTGAAHAYGYANGSFGYGYGNEVCPLSIAPSSLPGGIVGTGYNSGLLTGSGGTGLTAGRNPVLSTDLASLTVPLSTFMEHRWRRGHSRSRSRSRMETA